MRNELVLHEMLISFRRHVVKLWIGADFSETKCRELSKIVAKCAQNIATNVRSKEMKSCAIVRDTKSK